MSQEKQLQMCTSGGGIRASPRKFKQNKAPQRGLGVEKLEKIRLEEQRKNGGVGGDRGNGNGPAVVMPLPPPPRRSPPPPIPFPPASLSDFTTSSAMSSSLVNISSSNSLYGSRITKPMPSSSLPSLGWSFDHGGFGTKMLLSDSTINVETDLGLKYMENDTKPNWPPVGVMQWRQQSPNQFSSFMNPPLSSSSSSSGLNFQLEPPSNQNTYHSYNQSNNYMHPFAHEDHKVSGMKRPWPFALDNLPDPFSGNVASYASPFVPRPDDSYGKRNPALREGPSNSTLNWRGKWELNQNKRIKENTSILDREFLNPNKRRKENGSTDRNFLSLSLGNPSAKYNHPTFPFPPPDYHELSKIDVLPFQRNIQDQAIHEQQQQQNFLNSKDPTAALATPTGSKVELDDGLDLTLKL